MIEARDCSAPVFVVPENYEGQRRTSGREITPEEALKDVLFNMNQWKNRLGEDTRGLLLSLECIFEILVLSVLYYVLWRGEYFDDGIFPNYYFNGKYVLMGVYALLLYWVFKSSDSFKFGQLKGMDILVGQWISILRVNFVTYCCYSTVYFYFAKFDKFFRFSSGSNTVFG